MGSARGVDPDRLRPRVLQDLGLDQAGGPDDDVRRGDGTGPAQGDQIGRAGSGADEGDLAAHSASPRLPRNGGTITVVK